jgi:hypothetical protein
MGDLKSLRDDNSNPPPLKIDNERLKLKGEKERKKKHAHIKDYKEGRPQIESTSAIILVFGLFGTVAFWESS